MRYNPQAHEVVIKVNTSVMDWSTGISQARTMQACISGIVEFILVASSSIINMNERDNNTVNARTLLGPRYHHPILLPKPVPDRIHDILDFSPPAQNISHTGYHEISIIQCVSAEHKLRTDTYDVPDAPVSMCTGVSYTPAAEEHVAPHTMVQSQSRGDYRGSGIGAICGDAYHHVHCGDTRRRVAKPRTYSINGELPAPRIYGGVSEYERSNRSWNHGVRMSTNAWMIAGADPFFVGINADYAPVFKGGCQPGIS
ncbi:hypothetical protein L211DRAFT_869660 [Terfezia boudieri ATCC MYA-4762]|uniref:Uncharacterized protein n=1 Tax=Terfezia boudieri ATCC MYA-4762 TaxID=1051890 RepID=A0A3N4LG35_9PEZI|nr:hypothetical protein L211DRAFT_869660 [Terfezia boudieri ATCC MYA-4762]